ncbi:MAG: 50S ribosomal protein L34 [Patescibacteria group bacterium]|nr:50S ribosomal protein L34 [Patescibacteria group bacterium]
MPKRTYQPRKKKRARNHGFRAQQNKMSGKKGKSKVSGKSIARARAAKGRKRQTHSNHPRYK